MIASFAFDADWIIPFGAVYTVLRMFQSVGRILLCKEEYQLAGCAKYASLF